MTKQDAYRIVYNDILNRDAGLFLGLFLGRFDAKNGSKDYMYGIETVMSFIALECSESDCKDFQEIFSKNFLESLDKAR